MKRINPLVLALLMLGLPFLANAQSSAIDRYYNDYKQDDRFTHITVSSKMFSLFVNFEMDDPAEQELVRTISKLKGLKVLVGREVEEAPAIYKGVAKMPSGKMEELMTITETDSEFKFFISEADGKISELLMIGYESNEVLVISIVGEINLREISALSKKMNIEGFENFNNVGKL